MKNGKKKSVTKTNRRQFELLEDRNLLAGFTAYNSYFYGDDTDFNATSIIGGLDAGGFFSSGELVDFDTANELEVTLDTSGSGGAIESDGGGTPHPDSDAGQIFGDVLDFDGFPPSDFFPDPFGRSTVDLNSTAEYSQEFGNLDRGQVYDFVGTAVAGDASYTNRWTLVELIGADSFVAAHSIGDGVYTDGLADNQVAIWTGDQTQADQGFVAQWVSINPGTDGKFEIVSKQYTGPIPTSIDAGGFADGPVGYGILATRLIEREPSGPPVIENLPATEVTGTSAILNGQLVTTGGEQPEITLYFGTSDGGTEPTAWENAIGLPFEIDFSSSLEGLNDNTTYFFRSFAESPLGSDWADSSSSFTTLLVSAPSVVTQGVTNVVGVSAILGGNVTSTGNDAPIASIYYGLTDGGSDPNAWDQSIDLGVQSGQFGVQVDQLTELSDYFFNVRGENSIDAVWGETQSFTTTEIPVLLINEFMTSNSSTLATRVRSAAEQPFLGDTRSPDWIELRNTLQTPADLTGFFLTDDLGSPEKWQFPDGTTIPADGYLVVFASGLDVQDPALDENGYLHTSFRLSTLAGNDIALVNPDGNFVYAVQDMPGQTRDISYGASAQGDLRFFATPTPGSSNPTSPAAPVIQVPSRTFTGSVTVGITRTNPSNTIYYTTDEQSPTTASNVYSGPLTVTSTTNVRAIAVDSNGQQSVVVSEAYIRLADSVANDSTHLPILIVDTFDGFDPQSGFGDDFVAIIEPGNDGLSSPTDDFDLSTRAGVRIRGSSSSGFAKKQYRVEFRDENGEDRKLPVLGMPAEADWIFYGPSRYDRNLISNPLMYDLSNQIGRYATRTKWVEAYFNGEYFGVYAIMEVIEAGEDRVDVEELTSGADGQPIEGGFIWKNDRGNRYVTVPPESTFRPQREYVDSQIDALRDAANSRNFKDPDIGYAAYAEVDSFVDHNLLNMLAMNVDALRLSTFYSKTADGKLKAGPIWDFDRSLDSTDDRDNNPRTWFGTGDSTRYFDDGDRVQSWWPNMFQDPDFVQQYIDRWFELRQTMFSDENLTATIDKHANELGEAATRDYALWANARFGGTFQGEIAHLKEWLLSRVEWIDSQWMAAPTSDAAAEQVPVGTMVNITAGAGTVYYMLDGTDPRGEDGQIRAEATELSGPIEIVGSTTLVARRYQADFGADNGYVRTGDDWSAPMQISASSVAADATNFAITEVHFNPAAADVAVGENDVDNDEFEFLELTNVGSQMIELEGVQLTQIEIAGDQQGVEFRFDAQTLQPGESIVVVENVEAFRSRYGDSVRVALGAESPGDTPGQYGGKLSNGGERLTLVDSTGELVRQIDYDDWFESTDGGGASLVIVDASVSEPLQLAMQSAWQPSDQANGDPGSFQLGQLGDFDDSGMVDITDVDLFYAGAFEPTPDLRFDLTKDGSVGQEDLDFLIEAVIKTRVGDTDLDGAVDSRDLGRLLNSFGESGALSWGQGNLNVDQFVNSTDLGLLLNNFGVAVARTSRSYTCDLVGAASDCSLADFGTLSSTAVTQQAIEEWVAEASGMDNEASSDFADICGNGDVNLDGAVNHLDLGLLLNSFGKEEGVTHHNGNVNGDAVVNSIDLGLMLNNFGLDSDDSEEE